MRKAILSSIPIQNVRFDEDRPYLWSGSPCNVIDGSYINQRRGTYSCVGSSIAIIREKNANIAFWLFVAIQERDGVLSQRFCGIVEVKLACTWKSEPNARRRSCEPVWWVLSKLAKKALYSPEHTVKFDEVIASAHA
jgi:hypothetical protein